MENVVDVDTNTRLKRKHQMKFAQNFLYLTEWFHQQNKFKTEFDSMRANEIKI